MLAMRASAARYFPQRHPGGAPFSQQTSTSTRITAHVYSWNATGRWIGENRNGPAGSSTSATA